MPENTRRRNVFIIGSDEFNLKLFESVPKADQYEFHPLYRFGDIRGSDRIAAKATLRDAEIRMRECEGGADAVVSYGDFPMSTMLPILRARLGLPSPTLESVLKCEHKFWSRLEQREALPNQVPRFAAVDPFADDPFAGLDLGFPFWMKPVKGVLSYLGFKIEEQSDFDKAIAITRDKIERFAKPFNFLLEFSELPPAVAEVDGWHCIAEQIVSTTHQCTAEGYVYRGEVTVYGIIDSKSEGPRDSSFSRYQYPTRLPRDVQQRIVEASRRVMTRIGYDNAPFNIEYYWDADRDTLWILEINPRLSKSHCPLFQMVDGAGHFQVMIDLALGDKPEPPFREGQYPLAAKFMVRRYEDAVVSSVASDDRIREIEADTPGVMIHKEVEAGTRLSDLPDQDAYSFEVAAVFLGADSEDELEQKYQSVLEQLDFEFTPATGSDPEK